MVSLGEIRGQERAIRTLRAALASSRVPHAYLFTGPPQSGKTSAAIALAAAINCLEHPGSGCGNGPDACASCSRIFSGRHPDVRILERQGAAQIIPIETIRTQVLASVGLPPHEARARFFIIEEATAMRGPAANALLKTLEEPPDRTHFVLATVAPEGLLPTIRSRCQRVAFSALSPEIAASIQNDGDDLAAITELTDGIESTLDGGDLHSVAEAIAKQRDVAGPALLLLAMRFRDRAANATRANDLASASISAQRAQAVMRTEAAIRVHNAHHQLAVESLICELREVLP